MVEVQKLIGGCDEISGFILGASGNPNFLVVVHKHKDPSQTELMFNAPSLEAAEKTLRDRYPSVPFELLPR